MTELQSRTEALVDQAIETEFESPSTHSVPVATRSQHGWELPAAKSAASSTLAAANEPQCAHRSGIAN